MGRHGQEPPRRFSTSSFLLALALPLPSLAADDASGVDFFEAKIRPVLAARCYKCHSAEIATPKGRLRLDSRVATRTGGVSGPAVVPGEPEESLLYRAIAQAGEIEPMPPREKLPDGVIADFHRWIEIGAPDPRDAPAVASGTPDDWWSLRPVVRPPLPVSVPCDDAGWVRTPIDAFILAALQARGWKPAPEADRRTLIRRLSFDLIGLPPTPEEVEAFLADPRADAYEQLVERLLASPHHGERWGRHWLDVVRYGDSHGYDKDKPRPNAWPYRDYVIRAFNEDRPYDRFVREQVAGDVLFPGTRDGIEALGFLAAGPWDMVGHAEVPETKVDGQIARLLDRDDMVSNTLNTFNSLTVQCARCHDHKFDPVTQEDYYSLQAVFAALDRAERPYDPDPEIARRRAELSARRQTLGDAIARLAADPGARQALEALTGDLAQLDRQAAELPKPRQVYCGMVYHGNGSFRGTGADGGKARPIRVLRRGDVRDPRQEVGPGTVPLVPGVPARFAIAPDAPEGERRAELARWITEARHPLTWRSIVNRVWHYHFGRGIVDSPNDFGRMGRPPSHPELLDWLAVEFREGGGSIKRLHRLIVTSATYRQSSEGGEAQAQVDASHIYLGRMPRRRLEAEAIRDSVLAVAGRLDTRPGGPGFHDFVVVQPEHSPHYEYRPFDPDDARSHRRTIYRFVVRSQPQPFLATLDCADPSMSVEKRNESLTALQALALLNNRFMVAMAGHFAERLRRDSDDLPTQVDRAFRLALARPPAPDERESLEDHARRFGLPSLCRVIFNLNEFVFVD